jgi:pyruvate dehydrogenase E2 component (dihydrolipoamide acetyltransferase)
MIEIRIPEIGENVESGVVTQVMVAQGDAIAKDQSVIELETDKATIEIPSEASGIVHQVMVKKGDTVKIDQVILQLAETDSPENAIHETPADAPSTPGPVEPKKIAEVSVTPSTAPFKQAAAKEPLPLSQKELIDVSAAPSVRRFAREIGIRIVDVPGTGPGGRIFKDDVKKYAKRLNEERVASADLTVADSGVPRKRLPNFELFGNTRREPMNTIRKKTIENLGFSHQVIPPVTAFDEADITALEELRKKKSSEGTKLTLTPFLVAVLGRALKQFPKFNASIDGETEEVIYKEYVNIGVAVDTERGLVVPVIRGVPNKTVMTLASEMSKLAEKARQKKIMPDELAGGSMTLTNLGGIGGIGFTPIVFWPEVAILGVSRGAWQPRWNGQEFTPRFLLPLSLSYDHRLIDGADGARFLRWVCSALERFSVD